MRMQSALNLRAFTLIATLSLIFLSPVGCSSDDGTDAVAGPEVGSISPTTFLATPPEGAVVLDVRTPDEYASGHVPGAINIPHTEVASRLSEVSTDPSQTVIVYCERGGRAGKAEADLLAAGFTSVVHLEGDMQTWRAEGRPLIRR